MNYKTQLIVLIRTFDFIINYLHMIRKKMSGSGYAEIITETNLTTSGCMKRVLSGKQFNKSIWCLKILRETKALERVLLEAFFETRQGLQHDSDFLVFETMIDLIHELTSIKFEQVPGL